MNFQKKTFLVVDDHLAMRRTLSTMLIQMGAKHVVEAANGEVALEKLRDEKIDFIISDWYMPVIDGLPGNWVGSARVESQEWWTPGDALVDAPRLQSVVLLEKWADPARGERREAMAYNAETECDVYNWQLGSHRGGVIVERIGGTQGGPDIPGDESKAVGMSPVYDFFLYERQVSCPGVPSGFRP